MGAAVPTEIANSSYLDLNSYRSTADPLTGGTPVASFTMNVALVFERANDPTALLNSNWASRHSQLDAYNQAGTLWSTYGANLANYNQVSTDLATMGIQTVDQITPADQTNGYVSSAESRTIWVHLNQDTFATLFGTQLVQGPDHLNQTATYWEGNLSLPDGWQSTLGVQGLWFDTYDFEGVVASNPGTSGHAPNRAAKPRQQLDDLVAAIPSGSRRHYNFPLTGALRDPASGQAVTTGAIGLVEPLIGSALLGGSFQQRIDDYRKLTGIHTPATVITVAEGGQAYISSTDDGGERSLDVGIATAINPQSPLVLLRRLGQRLQRAVGNLHRLSIGDLGHHEQHQRAVLVVGLRLPADRAGLALPLRRPAALRRRGAAQHHGADRQQRRRLGRSVRQRRHQRHERPDQPVRLDDRRQLVQQPARSQRRHDAGLDRVGGAGRRPGDHLAARAGRPHHHADHQRSAGLAGRDRMERLRAE